MLLYIALPLTILIFVVSKRIYSFKPWAIFHPFLLSVLSLLLLHYFLKLDYSEYERGTSLLTSLLEPAVVTLAIPLYLQLHLIKAKFNTIIIACLLSVTIAFISAFYIMPLLGADLIIAASFAGQHVTTPIAMAISETVGGVVSLTAAMVLFVGILGASIGNHFMTMCGIKDNHAKGVAIGCASHALGTAKLLEIDKVGGAFASVALIICAVASAILMPLLYALLIN
ncbi:MAG: LrgB family protein [Psychromonas sp.]